MSLGKRHNGQPFRAPYSEALQKLVELFAVLRHINAFCRCSEDFNAVLVKIFRKIDCRLSAESNNNALRLFHIDNVHNVLGCKRFEIKSVGSVEICRNGFGVIVDYDNLVTELFKRPHTVNGGIVKFDSLPDADRSRTEHDNLFVFRCRFARFAVIVTC